MMSIDKWRHDKGVNEIEVLVTIFSELKLYTVNNISTFSHFFHHYKLPASRWENVQKCPLYTHFCVTANFGNLTGGWQVVVAVDERYWYNIQCFQIYFSFIGIYRKFRIHTKKMIFDVYWHESAKIVWSPTRWNRIILHKHFITKQNDRETIDLKQSMFQQSYVANLWIHFFFRFLPQFCNKTFVVLLDLNIFQIIRKKPCTCKSI